MKKTLTVLLIALLPLLLRAQVPAIVDPKIQKEPNEDVREIKTRDEMARQAELDESLRLPNSAERNARHSLRVQDFTQDVLNFESSIATLSTFRPNGTYSPQTLRTIQNKSKDVGRSVQHMLAYLESSKGRKTVLPDLPADSIEQKTGLLCLLATRLDPKLNQLLNFERRNLNNALLRQEVVGQLRLIAFISKQIGR